MSLVDKSDRMFIIISGCVAVFKSRDNDELKAEKEFLRYSSSIVENSFIKSEIALTADVLDFLDESIAQHLEPKLKGVLGGTSI